MSALRAGRAGRPGHRRRRAAPRRAARRARAAPALLAHPGAARRRRRTPRTTPRSSTSSRCCAASSRSPATSRRWATTTPTTSPRRSTAPSRSCSRSPSAASSDSMVGISDALQETLDQLEALYGDERRDHRCADRVRRPRRPPARPAAVEPHRRRGPPGCGQDRASRSAPRPTSRWRPGGRCCSSRWRWAPSSSRSACSRVRRASTRASCRPATSPKATGAG